MAACLAAWLSWTQKCVLRSTSDAEYLATGDGVKESLFVNGMLQFLLLLNEYNAVSGSKFLGGGAAGDTANGSDATFGRVAGNGGDWFELVVLDNLALFSSVSSPHCWEKKQLSARVYFLSFPAGPGFPEKKLSSSQIKVLSAK